MSVTRFQSSASAKGFDQTVLNSVSKKYPNVEVEYAELESGEYCVRTCPQAPEVLPLAAIGKDLSKAVERLLLFVKSANDSNVYRDSK